MKKMLRVKNKNRVITIDSDNDVCLYDSPDARSYMVHKTPLGETYFYVIHFIEWKKPHYTVLSEEEIKTRLSKYNTFSIEEMRHIKKYFPSFFEMMK